VVNSAYQENANYRGELRKSEIDALFDKVSKRSYGRYLSRMSLIRVRSFENREISFDFPVTALVGPNGGGKTTVLGAAALIHGDVQPRRFFAKSGAYDTSMQNWRVEYELVDRSIQKTGSVARTASYLRAKWNRDAVARKVLVFGVTRTLPASERKELTKCISGSFEGYGERTFGPEVVKAVEQILGKEAENYLRVAADEGEKVAIYAARLSATKGYSEFHFGAGEASVIRIVSQIEEVEENSLILIEEIENGLHPVATRRLVEYLVKVAARKSCQVIFTTHSNDAIAPLPSKAVWVAYNGTLTQGKLDVRALRTLTGHVEARLAIFVEDAFAEELALSSLRAYKQSSPIDIPGIVIHGVGGAGQATKLTKYHNDNPTIAFPALCVLDGDQRLEGQEGQTPKEIYFPGTSDPEAYVFEKVVDRLDELLGRLTVMMQLPPTEQQRVRSVVQNRALTNDDRHIIYGQIGEDLDFTSEIVVQRAFMNSWAQYYEDEVQELWSSVDSALPKIDEDPK